MFSYYYVHIIHTLAIFLFLLLLLLFHLQGTPHGAQVGHASTLSFYPFSWVTSVALPSCPANKLEPRSPRPLCCHFMLGNSIMRVLAMGIPVYVLCTHKLATPLFGGRVFKP